MSGRRVGVAVTRYEIQVVLEGGAYLKWQSRRDYAWTPLAVAESLEKIAATIRKGQEAADAK